METHSSIIQEQIFLCPVCKKKCKTLASLKTHFNEKHVLDKCPVCGKTIDLGSMSAVSHFSKKNDRHHLAFAYLYLRSSHKKLFWDDVCEAATDYFSSLSSLIFLLKKDIGFYQR